jgi:hypothetical protein
MIIPSRFIYVATNGKSSSFVKMTNVLFFCMLKVPPCSFQKKNPQKIEEKQNHINFHHPRESVTIEHFLPFFLGRETMPFT